jgi:hypothetical protein
MDQFCPLRDIRQRIPYYRIKSLSMVSQLVYRKRYRHVYLFLALM